MMNNIVIKIEEAINGYVVNISDTDKERKFVTETFDEAIAIASRYLEGVEV